MSSPRIDASCRENPNLRVHRLVNIWKTVFPVTNYDASVLGQASLQWGLVTQNVAGWLIEAETLIALGMPRDCFTFTFDAGSLPEDATALSGLILEDGAEQAAMDHCVDSHLSEEENRLERRAGIKQRPLRYFQDFPRLIRQLATNTSQVVCCYFDFGANVNFEFVWQQRVPHLWEWDDFQRWRFQRLLDTSIPVPAEQFLQIDRELDIWIGRMTLATGTGDSDAYATEEV